MARDRVDKDCSFLFKRHLAIHGQCCQIDPEFVGYDSSSI